MHSRIFANLGFLLQIAGLLATLPIGIGLYFIEIQDVISLFLACVALLGCGFLMNSLCERFTTTDSNLALNADVLSKAVECINNCTAKPIAQTRIGLCGWSAW